MSESIPSTPPGVTSGPRPTAATPDAKAIGPRLPALTVGMRLEIQLVKELSSNQVEVRLRPLEGNAPWSAANRLQLVAPLPARLADQLAAGTDPRAAVASSPRIQAEVVAISPTLVLRPLLQGAQTNPSRMTASATGAREWLDSQLRLNLPQSRPLSDTLNNWISRLIDPAGFTASPARHSSTMADATQRMIETILGRLTTTKDLTDPLRLPEAIRQSGLWLEAHLARAVTNPEQTPDPTLDLKAQLLRLAEQIRTANPLSPTPAVPLAPSVEHMAETPPPHPLPDPAGSNPSADPPPSSRSTPPATNPDPPLRSSSPETIAPSALAREVDGMLKQVVTQQLQSLEAGADQPRWLLELPFKTPAGLQALEADIRRENRTGQPEDETWSMRLRLNLPRLGPVSINLSLRTERLNAGLHAETEASAEILRAHLPELRRQLEAREIQIASLHANYRPPSEEPPPEAPRPPLVSELA